MKTDVQSSIRGVLVSAVVLGVLAAPAAAQQADTADTGEHVVRRGDTLWDLAGQYLNDPFQWTAIYELNRSVVEDPDLIYPAERLRIPGIGSPEPTVVMETPGMRFDRQPVRSRFYRAAQTAQPAAEPTVAEEEAADGSPVQPREFRAAPWLEPQDALEVVGRTVRPAGPDGRMDDVALPAIHPFDGVTIGYADGERPEVGTELLLVRVGRRIDDLGRVVEPTALVKVTGLADEVMTAEVTKQFGVVAPDNVAVVPEPFPGVEAPARPVEDGPAGRIVAFLDEQTVYGVTDRAFVDLGRRQGVHVGDEFLAFAPERRAEVNGSQTLPAEPVARLRVIRVTEETATARVVELRHPVLEPGMPVRLVRKVP